MPDNLPLAQTPCQNSKVTTLVGPARDDKYVALQFITLVEFRTQIGHDVICIRGYNSYDAIHIPDTIHSSFESKIQIEHDAIRTVQFVLDSKAIQKSYELQTAYKLSYIVRFILFAKLGCE